MSLLICIVIGLTTGWLSTVFARGGGFGIIADILIGIAGAMFGWFVATETIGEM